jgi:hypothetical protein
VLHLKGLLDLQVQGKCTGKNFSDASKCISPVDYGKRVTFRCLDSSFSENNLNILLLNTFLLNSIEKITEKMVAFGIKILLKLFGVF